MKIFYDNLKDTTFKEFLGILRSDDNILMGCNRGRQRTSQALFLNHFLNSKRPSGAQTLKCLDMGVGNYTLLENFQNTEKIFEALTQQQKTELGIADRKLPKIDMTDLDNAAKKVKEAFLAN